MSDRTKSAQSEKPVPPEGLDYILHRRPDCCFDCLVVADTYVLVYGQVDVGGGSSVAWLCRSCLRSRGF